MTTTPAGWYPDPYGSPQLRWWDGSQWTDATHPRDTYTQEAAPPPDQPAQTAPLRAPLRTEQPAWGHLGQPPLPAPAFGRQPKPAPVWPWIVGGIAALVAVVVAISAVVIFVNNRSGITASRPDEVVPSAPLDSIVPPSPSPAAPLTELPQPSGDRISDPTTGLSYAFPGEPWSVPKSAEINNPENPQVPLWTSGYSALSQQNYDGSGGDWVGSIYAAQLPQVLPYGGPKDLRTTVTAMVVGYEPLFYAPQHERKILRDEALEVSGHKAWVTEFEMDFSKESAANGWKWKTEKGAFVLVDRGQGRRPSMLYMSVPDNLDQSVLNRVLDSLEAR
ncbi:DUF2510 domain-containing protein [Planotetraspora mira]|uniref:DUF2510 domain-containing protein n=1 Tax=Planotetraspora mira TaxID=58121 RepID=A0A8J3TKV2_9ACTN|nr:DUF2510 domain-containing protein [Planotetraspora mira]GII28928.1 hypothetical protein Pmi06nite_23700 [Planotetraspora mira]